MTEQDERVYGMKPSRPSLSAERRGIERYLKTFQYVVCRELPDVCQVIQDEVEEQLNRVAAEYASIPLDAVPEMVHPRQDTVDNFLYNEWFEQRNRVNGIQAFASYAVFVSAKAVISLLTEHMADVRTTMEIPFPNMREDALRFKQRDDYDETNPVWYLSHVFVDVPGSWEASQTLQLIYGDMVRVERRVRDVDEPTVLPDDPLDKTLETRYDLPEDIRIDAAIQAVLGDEGTVDQIATQYGIGQKRFRRILKELDLMPSRGGDRKG